MVDDLEHTLKRQAERIRDLTSGRLEETGPPRSSMMNTRQRFNNPVHEVIRDSHNDLSPLGISPNKRKPAKLDPIGAKPNPGKFEFDFVNAVGFPNIQRGSSSGSNRPDYGGAPALWI